jgi:hypothetical protein
VTCRTPQRTPSCSSAAERATLLDVLRHVERVPDLVGRGPHLLLTARRPPQVADPTA